MIRLLFIVPYPELEETVRLVLSRHPQRDLLDADIRCITVENIPEIPDDTYDAIIARGYTAMKTLDGCQRTPTIQLSITGYDLVRAVSECCETYHPRKIAVCGCSITAIRFPTSAFLSVKQRVTTAVRIGLR